MIRRLQTLFKRDFKKQVLLYESRRRNSRLFGERIRDFKNKLQIGVRGRKNGPDWVSVDLYDTSDLIDYNYDIQNLPFEDNHFDCIVCNAILEHVPEPELAIYEMHRILRPGGQIWIEVPFLQAYHAHPHDYWRCTLPGIRRWMEDFVEVAAGIFEGFSEEATVQFDIFHSDFAIPPENVSKKRKILEEYVRTVERQYGPSKSLYSATYYWGEKPRDRGIPEPKKQYMEHLKQGLTSR